MNERQFIVYTSEEPVEDIEGDDVDDQAAAERRRHQRFRVGVFAEIERGVENPSRSPSLTYNMSRSGALLLTMAPLEPGEEVTVSFISSTNEREDTPVRVVHGDRLFKSMVWSRKIGVEFVDQGPSFLENELSFSD